MLTWKKREHPAAVRSQETAFLRDMKETLFLKLQKRTDGDVKLPMPPRIEIANRPLVGLVDFETEIGDVSPAELEKATAEVWSKALDEIESAYPSGGWEILIVYVTVETGNAMIYPATMARLDDGSAKIRVIAHSTTWENAYSDITEPEESRKFNTAYNKVLKAIVKTLKEAVESSAVSARFKALKKNPSFGIYYVDAVETVRREGLQFLWGNKAPDGLPTGSAKEMFEALLRRESSYIGTNQMIYDGDILRVVKLEGANFDDKYVSILATVPNVAQLCNGLREIQLLSTRIKPPAVERLRTLFPDVDVQVFVYKDNVGWLRKDK
jgi:hypothetical protein